MTHLTGSGEPAPSGDGQSSGTGTQEHETSWRDSLNDDFRDHKSLETFNDVNDLAKSFIHAQGMIGKDKVIIPTDSSTPEEVAEFYGKLGMPTPEEYKVDGLEGDLKEAFIKNNILPNQASGMLEVINGLVNAQDSDSDAEYEAAMQAELENLKTEWGEAYEGNMQRAAEAFKTFGDEETAQYLDETGLGNDPTLIKLFSNIGAKLGEGDFKGQAKPSMTKETAKKRINELYADVKGPLYDTTNPRRGDVLKELEALSLIANS